DAREVLHLALDREGYQVREAANGLRLLSTLHVDRPDLILLDVMMSWIDGFELCGAIKRNPVLATIPVLFITARTSREDERKGYACGAGGYLRKPIDLEKLVKEVARLIGPASDAVP